MERALDLTGKILAIASLALIGYFGEKGADGGFIKDVWSAAKTASPFAAMFAILAWLGERKERQEAQKQCNDRTIDFVQSTNSATSALNKALQRFTTRRGGRGRRRR